MMSWPSSVILIIKVSFSGMANLGLPPFLTILNVRKFLLLMCWIVVLVLVVHSEKKVMGLHFCICEVKGGTRYISSSKNRCSQVSPLYDRSLLVIILCPFCMDLFWTLTDDDITIHCPSFSSPLPKVSLLLIY